MAFGEWLPKNPYLRSGAVLLIFAAIALAVYQDTLRAVVRFPEPALEQRSADLARVLRQGGGLSEGYDASGSLRRFHARDVLSQQAGKCLPHFSQVSNRSYSARQGASTSGRAEFICVNRVVAGQHGTLRVFLYYRFDTQAREAALGRLTTGPDVVKVLDFFPPDP